MLTQQQHARLMFCVKSGLFVSIELLFLNATGYGDLEGEKKRAHLSKFSISEATHLTSALKRMSSQGKAPTYPPHPPSYLLSASSSTQTLTYTTSFKVTQTHSHLHLSGTW